MPPSLESQRHSPAAAYLRHLQQKNQNSSSPPGKTSRTAYSSNSDHRQTIVSPVAQERNVFHPPTTSPVFSKKSPVTLQPTNSSSNRTSTSPPAATSNKPKKRTSSSRKSGKKSRSHNSSKTLRAKPPLFNSKHPRSVISETTNSTYLSSDSEEEDATVETDSHHSCSVQSGISIRSGRSGHSSNPEQRSTGSHHPDSTSSSASVDASSALVPYQQQPQEQGGPQPHPPQYHHSYQQNHQQSSYLSSSHRPVVSTDYEDDLADAFQYSDGEDDHVVGGVQALQEVISDDTTTSDDSDTLADLDQLIAESSARWKHTVHSTVQNTVTAKTVGSLVSASQQQQLAQQQQQHRRHYSDITASPGELLPSLLANGLHISNSMEEQQPPQSIQQPLLPVQHILEPASSHGGGGEVDDEELTVWSGFHSTVHRPDAASVAPSVDLHPHHHHLPPSNHHHHPSNSTNHNNDDDVLQQQHRQVVEVSGRTLELQSSVSGVTRRAVFSGTMVMVNNNNGNNHLDESSSSSNGDDEDTTTTTKITGTGVLQFVETGDVYRGSLVESEMHGRGTYTFAATGKTLQGVFEHNVYVG